MSTSTVPLGNGIVVVTHVYQEPDASARGGAVLNERAPPLAPSWLENGLLRSSPPQNGGFTGKLCLIDTFVRREQTTLGTLQILIGVITFMFGIVTVIEPVTASALSGIMFWGSFSHIIAGCLTVVASRNPSLSLVSPPKDNKLLLMNIFSSTTAGVATVLYCVDFGLYNYDMIRVHGISGVMFILSLVELMVSAAVSFSTYNAIYCTHEMSNNISSQEAQYSPPSYAAATTVNTSETKFFASAVAPPSSLSSDLPLTA